MFATVGHELGKLAIFNLRKVYPDEGTGLVALSEHFACIPDSETYNIDSNWTHLNSQSVSVAFVSSKLSED